MNIAKYRQLRAIVVVFVTVVVALAVIRQSYLLASAGVLTGLLFLSAVRSKVKIVIDEREKTVREKAAQLTYAIFAPILGIAAFLMLFPSYSGLSVFVKGEFLYLESLGMVFAYLTFFLIALYAVSYHFYNHKFGGGGNEE